MKLWTRTLNRIIYRIIGLLGRLQAERLINKLVLLYNNILTMCTLCW